MKAIMRNIEWMSLLLIIVIIVGCGKGENDGDRKGDTPKSTQHTIVKTSTPEETLRSFFDQVNRGETDTALKNYCDFRVRNESELPGQCSIFSERIIKLYLPRDSIKSMNIASIEVDGNTAQLR